MLKRSSKRERGEKRNLRIEFNKLSTIEGARGQKKSQQRKPSNSDNRSRGDSEKYDNIFRQRLELKYKPEKIRVSCTYMIYLKRIPLTISFLH